MSDSMVESARALYERTFRGEKRKVTPWNALPDWAQRNWIEEAKRLAALDDDTGPLPIYGAKNKE